MQDPGLEGHRPLLITNVLVTLSRFDPNKAMNIALDLPIPVDGTGHEASVVRQLASIDIDKAIEFASRTREGETRIQAYRSIASQLVRRKDIDGALDLAREVPDYARKDYLSEVLDRWSTDDPLDLYESLDDLPSAETASLAALNLLIYDPRGEILTADQAQKARSYLSEEDLQEVERRLSKQ